jgi:hypothetical protein
MLLTAVNQGKPVCERVRFGLRMLFVVSQRNTVTLFNLAARQRRVATL